jgi:uncharacterized glyoxalase superfamily protein PhnB
MPAIPEGFSTITPHLMLTNANEAINIYQKALGAQEVYKMMCPTGSGKVMHACLQIGNSRIFLADANPERGCAATTSSFYLYVNDADAACKQAKSAGLNETMAVQDQFWGDRTGSFKDPYGNSWTLATHVRDVSDAEMREAMKKVGSAKAA